MNDSDGGGSPLHGQVLVWALYVGEVLSFPWRPQEAGAHVVPHDTGGR